MKRKLSEQEIVRRKKLQDLRDKNIDPFGSKFLASSNTKEVKEKFANYSKEELESLKDNKVQKFAGRLMTKRGKGKAGFCHIQDFHGQIQAYIREDSIGEKDFQNIWETLDLGDIVGIEGKAMKTKVGELSIKADKLTLLTKALKPLPDKFHGLQDEELRVRNRHLDLIVNQKSKETLILRSKIVRSIQNYLDSLNYIEVETPVLQSYLGGAAAKPFITHHNTLNMNFYLRIATEIPLKKLIVGGMEKVYEIGRLFRNEGVSKKHNPEFTAIELYQAYADYEDMMQIAEDIFKHINKYVFNSQNVFEYDGHKVDITKPFKKIHMVDFVKQETGIDFWKDISLEEAIAFAKEKGIYIEKHWTDTGHILNALFEEFCEDKIIEPTFVHGHPKAISPLSKANSKDSRYTDRFELFILGREYANAFSELNDPIDQLERFEKQIEEKDLGNEEANEIDIDFIEALETGLPPTAGMGIGIDRLVMFFTGSPTIRDVILFPHNRKAND